MSKRINEEQRTHRAPRWKGRDSLDLVHGLNQRALRAVAEGAGSGLPCEVPAIAENRALWSELQPDGVKRLARLPFVLLDAHFRNDEWWEEVTQSGATTALRGANRHALPAKISSALMSEMLIFAWHTAKWDPRVARLSFGMAQKVADTIATLTPESLASLVARYSGELTLQWPDRTEFWRHALLTAQRGNDAALAEVHLHAQLLFCGELIPVCL